MTVVSVLPRHCIAIAPYLQQKGVAVTRSRLSSSHIVVRSGRAAVAVAVLVTGISKLELRQQGVERGSF